MKKLLHTLHPFRNLRRRILSSFILLLGLAFWHYSTWVSDNSRRHYLEAAEEALIDQCADLRHFVIQDGQINFKALDRLDKQVKKIPEATIYHIKKTSSDSQIYISDKHGKIIAHSDKSELGKDYENWRNIRLALTGKYGARATRLDKDDPSSSVMHISLPLYSKIDHGDLLGTITVAKPVKRLSLYLDETRSKVLETAIITALLFMLCAYILIRKTVSPLEQLSEYTRQLADGLECQRPALPRGEIRHLGREIERMQSELDGKAYVETYVQSLTHELKSPLSAVLGASELLDSANTEQSQKLLANISRESQRMNQMVQEILFLSKLENKKANDLESCELVSIVKACLSEFSERFNNNKVEFQSSIELFQFKGEAQLACLAIQNILRNAQEFSPEGSKIQVNIIENSKNIVLSIRDQGPGIHEDLLPRIFERFFSTPRPKTGSKSSGLGLSISREIFSRYQASISASNSTPGLKVEITFPKNSGS